MRISNINIVLLGILLVFSLFTHVLIINNTLILFKSRGYHELTKNKVIKIQGDYDDIFGDILVLSPTDGDMLNKGDLFTIKWESSGGIKYVTIALYKSHKYIDTIALASINNGEFEWEVGTYNEGTDYTIGVWDYNDFNVADFSDYFVISSTQVNQFDTAFLLYLTIILLVAVNSIGVAYYLIRKYR
ncbi:MAG: Ser-Thr-rich GPI-anchored membrane family protein [Candidatus Hodarchaeota archaeon]